MMRSGQVEQQGAGERSGGQRKWLLKFRNVENEEYEYKGMKQGRIMPGPPQIFFNSSIQFSSVAQ